MILHDTIKNILRDIPDSLTGIDRQRAIGERLQNLPFEDRMVIRSIVEQALARMFDLHASDMDLGGYGCRNRFWFRIHGSKKPDMSHAEFSAAETDILCQSLLSPSQMHYLYDYKNLDFSYQIQQNQHLFRYRADVYFELDHLALNCRFIPDVIRPFKDLNLHPNIVSRLSLKTSKQGLTLVTGITGSGKSTTLDSIIDANNKTVDAHVIIISSPIETIHKPDHCIIRHREVGRDVASFKEGAIQSLRQDPDIIIIGEMRDPETIITALEITDSGHKVFSTLHTASAVESIDRIIAECPTGEQERVRNRLADTLECVLSQKLVPAVDGTRVLAMEIMMMTPSIKAAIKNNNIDEIYQMINEGKQLGMQTMEQHLLHLVRDGRISSPEAENYANNKNRMQELLGTAA